MKEQKYKQALQNIEALISNEEDTITKMATIACEVYQLFAEFNWVGFYRRVTPTLLKVGPYQGTHGCLTIEIGKGVCGTCLATGEVQIENDVTKVPHHIACSSDTLSEIVLPVKDKSGEVQAVFDIDCTEVNRFDEIDKKYLGLISNLVY